MKKLLSLICAASLALGCVGCDSIPNETDSSYDTQYPRKTDTYAIVVKDTSNPYMESMAQGFQSACEELGVNSVCLGPNTPSAAEQVEVINDLIEKEVSVIAVAVNDAQALKPSLQSALDKGIRVISLDSAADPDSRLLHIQQARPKKVGRVLMQAAASMIDGQGKVAVLSSTENSPNQSAWIDWMLKELSDPENAEKYKGIDWTGIVFGNDDSATSEAKTRELLQTYGDDLKIIIAPTVVGMQAAAKVIAETGASTKLTGLGLPSQMSQYFTSEDGICPWMYLWNVIDAGYLAAYAAHALSTGEIKGQPSDVFMAGRLGAKVVDNAEDGGNEVLLGDPIKVDKSNILVWESVY